MLVIFQVLSGLCSTAFFGISCYATFAQQADMRYKIWKHVKEGDCQGEKALKKGFSVCALILVLLPELLQWIISLAVVIWIAGNDKPGFAIVKMGVQAGWLFLPVMSKVFCGGCCAPDGDDESTTNA